MMTKKFFVDTNIFLRYLINDNQAISDKIERTFKKASLGEILLITNSLVIIEIIFVLESYYDKSKKEFEFLYFKKQGGSGLNLIFIAVFIF